MTQALADATTGNEVLYEILGNHRNQENITKSIRRKNVSALSIKFTNSFYVVTDQQILGKDWQASPIGRFDAIIKVHSVDRLLIKRRDFLQGWKPEPTYEPRRDTVVISKRFSSIREAKEAMKEFGQDIDTDLVNGDPIELMEIMLAAGASQRLELGS